ncbi:MAG: hypothetical protein P8L20_08570 [Flavobacteriales bacterium]|nr:hypothetical protein [Flavobacteriales bacterium]
MKNLTVFFALLFSTQYYTQKESQIIFNEVSIHYLRNHKIDNYWTNADSFLRTLDNELHNESLPIKQHHDLLNFILKGVKSGRLKTFMPDEYHAHLQPGDYFKTPICKDSLEPGRAEINFYEAQHNKHLNILNGFLHGYTIDPETDERVSELHIYPLKAADFVSFTFLEKWEFDIKKSLIVKTVNGITVNTFKINEKTGDVIGIDPRFHIKLNAFEKSSLNWKVAENYFSTSTISGNEQAKTKDIQTFWWHDNIESSKRINLIQPLFSGNLDYIEAIPPYNKTLVDKNKALYKYEKSPVYDEYGDELYDVVGDQIYNTDTSLYSYQDINKLGFIEDWYFDTIHFSFGKEIKAVAPCAKSYYENGELSKSKPLFLINVNGNTINRKVNDFYLQNHKSPLMLLNNKIQNINKNILIKNGFTIDSIDQIKMNSFFIKYPYFEDNKTYTSLYGNPYKIEKNTQQLMNTILLVSRMNYETGEYIYDQITGDVLYDSILSPFAYQDIIGFKFIEDWNYDISETRFDINITGVIPMIWHTNPETGDIIGGKELYMSKPNTNNKSEYTLIKSGHLFTEPLSRYEMNDFWHFKENTEWLYPQNRKELITSLLEGVKSKKAKVLDPQNNKKIKWKNRKSYIGDVTFADIESIQFEEDIYFNFASGHFKKMVKSATLILRGLDDEDRWSFPWLKIIFSDK